MKAFKPCNFSRLAVSFKSFDKNWGMNSLVDLIDIANTQLNIEEVRSGTAFQRLLKLPNQFIFLRLDFSYKQTISNAEKIDYIMALSMHTAFLCWALKLAALRRLTEENRKLLKISEFRIKITHLRTSEASPIDQNFNSCQFYRLLSVLNGVPDYRFNMCSIPIHVSVILLQGIFLGHKLGL